VHLFTNGISFLRQKNFLQYKNRTYGAHVEHSSNHLCYWILAKLLTLPRIRGPGKQENSTTGIIYTVKTPTLSLASRRPPLLDPVEILRNEYFLKRHAHRLDGVKDARTTTSYLLSSDRCGGFCREIFSSERVSVCP